MLFSLLTVGVSAQTVADGTAENMVVLAAEEKGNVTFTYPKDIDPEKTELEFYAGFPTSSSRTLEEMISRGELKEIKANADGSYTAAEPGVYSYHISGNGYYNILKIVNITQNDVDKGITIEVVGGPLGENDDEFGDGYQPTVKPSQAPDSYVMDARDAMLMHLARRDPGALHH